MIYTHTFAMRDRRGYDGEVEATFDYHNDPGQWSLSNGDPGWPGGTSVFLQKFSIISEGSDPDFQPDADEVEDYIYDNFDPDSQ